MCSWQSKVLLNGIRYPNTCIQLEIDREEKKGSNLVAYENWLMLENGWASQGDMYVIWTPYPNRFIKIFSWWRHQMETFSALLAICAGNSPVPGEFPTQRPVTRNFDVYFDLRPNKRLSKQSCGWWFETLSCSLWRHRNVGSYIVDPIIMNISFIIIEIALLFHSIFPIVTSNFVINYVRFNADT